ncbi:MAG: hypothetical protein J6Y13_01650, partial [Treponema sp.]|nr:hypothetical protein [Treponema sp.]
EKKLPAGKSGTDKSFLSFLLAGFHEVRPSMQYSWYRKVEARPGFVTDFGVSAGRTARRYQPKIPPKKEHCSGVNGDRPAAGDRQKKEFWNGANGDCPGPRMFVSWMAF